MNVPKLFPNIHLINDKYKSIQPQSHLINNISGDETLPIENWGQQISGPKTVLKITQNEIYHTGYGKQHYKFTL